VTTHDDPQTVGTLLPAGGWTRENIAAWYADRERDRQDDWVEELRRHVHTWPDHIPARFVGARVADLDGDLAAVAADWDGRRNVLFLGGVGVGKTHAAVAIARTRFEQGDDVMFAPSVELLDDLRPGGPEGTMTRACNVAVLVLDDLGAERPTDWTGERLYRIVNRRWLEGRTTIATSNLSAAELAQATGKRMWSRLFHDAVALELAGNDRRKAA
jgi:DNA replication protein DnaC